MFRVGTGSMRWLCLVPERGELFHSMEPVPSRTVTTSWNHFRHEMYGNSSRKKQYHLQIPPPPRYLKSVSPLTLVFYNKK